MERTLVLVKPDGVQRRLTGTIIERFERKGLFIRALKLMAISTEMAERHYAVHKGKPFFNDLIEYITSGPIVAMILEGNNAISTVRTMSGATDGSRAQPGTIRGDFCTGIQNNIVHASDSQESFEHESVIFFSNGEILDCRYMDEELV
ncbi:MAG: nucleoside-diphosphate kinase [Candidatus Thermoplasmatota archaeon]|nr:nucleoside-diphosphate kinase [Candidatus Thermoplasmatota archaeon]